MNGVQPLLGRDRDSAVTIPRNTALTGSRARLIDLSRTIDDTRTRARPAQTLLLGAGIPICEHMGGLELLPDAGFRFTAAPPKVKAFGTFPMRAFAQLG